MSKYYIFLGHTPKLSLLEIESLIHRQPLFSTRLFASYNLNQNELEKLQSSLGGSIKIALEITRVKQENLLKDIKAQILKSDLKNVAISNFSDLTIEEKDLFALKKEIKKTRAVRFLSFKTEDHKLVALRKQHVLELNIIQNANSLYLAKTVWIQNSDEWAKRDRKKPYQNIKKGMLPPKIARIMVNLATKGKQLIFSDPFCGTGTLIQEAAFLGNTVIVSDISQQAVEGTAKNLQWLKEEYNLELNYESHQTEASHLDEYVNSIDAIATEPYLGPLIKEEYNKPYIGGRPLSRDNLKNTIKGLDKMYKGALKSWHKILSEKGRVVLIFPEFHLFGQKYKLPLIDTCENLGYNKVAQEEYSKPNAYIFRTIVILEKNGKN